VEEEIYRKTISDPNRRIATNAKNGRTLSKLATDRVLTLLINGEEVLDYPRPFLPGMMFMEQLEDHTKTKELDETWKALVDGGRDGVILFSLGTVANTSMMPLKMKEVFADAFKNFPQYTIIWRLEGELPSQIETQKHIKIVRWLPQRDLLYQANVKLFITHGGYNSLVETAQAGVPMLLMPLFGDQQGNAKRAVRHQVGLELDKSQLDAKTISEKMNTILNDPKYTQRTSKLSKFMQNKLIANEDAIVLQVEKLARRRWWPMVQSRNLTYVQLFCLDIIFSTILFLITIIFISIKLIRYVISLISRPKNIS